MIHLQDGTGLWHNLLDQPRSYLETSASAIFVYSIAKGVNEGWLSHIYGSAALAGWNALVQKLLTQAKCAILWKVQRLLMIMFIILIEVKAVPPIFTEP